MKLHSPLIDWFDDMFQNLSPFTNDRNPWFQEYWQETYKCRIPGAKVTHYNNTCTGQILFICNYLKENVSSDRGKPKIIKLVFAASQLWTQEVITKICARVERHRYVPSGATQICSRVERHVVSVSQYYNNPIKCVGLVKSGHH